MKPYQVKSRRVAWSCPWYRVRQDEIVTPAGCAATYNVIEKPASVWVLPVTTNRDIVLIYNYRYAVDEWCWEIPAGNQEEGMNLQETAEAELKEEVGGVAKVMRYIGQFYAASGICNEVSHLFLATGVKLGEPKHEPTEVMEIHCKSIAETLSMARANQFQDGPSALALFLCEEKLRELDA